MNDLAYARNVPWISIEYLELIALNHECHFQLTLFSDTFVHFRMMLHDRHWRTVIPVAQAVLPRA